MAIVKRTDNVSCWVKYRGTGTLIHCHGNAKLNGHFGKHNVWFNLYEILEMEKKPPKLLCQMAEQSVSVVV